MSIRTLNEKLSRLEKRARPASIRDFVVQFVSSAGEVVSTLNLKDGNRQWLSQSDASNSPETDIGTPA